jgi:cold shock CspA family protein
MKGTVLFWLENDDRVFGFIAPDDGAGNRELNVWFGLKSLKGMTERPRSGDRVEYQPGIFRKGKGPSAERVTRCKGNEHEHQPSETSAERSSRSPAGAIHQASADQITTLPGERDTW